MKKVVLLILCILCLGNAWAQKRVGQFSFIPRVGLNLSNLGKADGFAEYPKFSDEETTDVNHSKTLPDFMIGGDVEYQITSPLAISLGAFYSRQGCRWADISKSKTDNDKTKWTNSIQDQAINLQYINVPVSAKLYINDFFAVHAGVQAGFLLDGKDKFVSSELMEPKEGDKKFTSEKHNEKMQDLNSIVWSIPVGASLEYENVIVDARYNIPLSRFSNQTMVPDGYVSTGGNRVWTISVGYRF